MGLRNLPQDRPRPLASLVGARGGQVTSRSLVTTDAPLDLTLLAFSADEGVSEETYFGDTLYCLLEGAATVTLPDRRADLTAGDCLMVPAGIEHALQGHGAFKVLQLTV